MALKLKNTVFYKNLSALYKLNAPSTDEVHQAVIGALFNTFVVTHGDIDQTRLQMCMLTATGPWLDIWGDYFNIPRDDDEDDDLYRDRILAETIEPKVTLGALKRASARWLNRRYGESYTPDDIRIFEPWRNLLKPSQRGTLSGDAHLLSADYWTYAVIDIAIPNASYLNLDLIQYLNEVKAAGVKIIWSVKPTWSLVTTGWKDDKVYSNYTNYKEIYVQSMYRCFMVFDGTEIYGAADDSFYMGNVLSGDPKFPLSGTQLVWANMIKRYWDALQVRHPLKEPLFTHIIRFEDIARMVGKTYEETTLDDLLIYREYVEESGETVERDYTWKDLIRLSHWGTVSDVAAKLWPLNYDWDGDESEPIPPPILTVCDGDKLTDLEKYTGPINISAVALMQYWYQYVNNQYKPEDSPIWELIQQSGAIIPDDDDHEKYLYDDPELSWAYWLTMDYILEVMGEDYAVSPEYLHNHRTELINALLWRNIKRENLLAPIQQSTLSLTTHYFKLIDELRGRNSIIHQMALDSGYIVPDDGLGKFVYDDPDWGWTSWLTLKHLAEILENAAGIITVQDNDKVAPPVREPIVALEGEEPWQTLLRLSHYGGVSGYGDRLWPTNYQEINGEDYEAWKTLIRLSEWGTVSDVNPNLWNTEYQTDWPWDTWVTLQWIAEHPTEAVNALILEEAKVNHITAPISHFIYHLPAPYRGYAIHGRFDDDPIYRAALDSGLIIPFNTRSVQAPIGVVTIPVYTKHYSIYVNNTVSTNSIIHNMALSSGYLLPEDGVQTFVYPDTEHAYRYWLSLKHLIDAMGATMETMSLEYLDTHQTEVVNALIKDLARIDNVLLPFQINGGEGEDTRKFLLKPSQWGQLSHHGSHLLPINYQEATDNISPVWEALLRPSDNGALSTDQAELLTVNTDEPAEPTKPVEPEVEVPDNINDDLIRLSNWGAMSTVASKLWFTQLKDNLELDTTDTWKDLLVASDRGAMSTKQSLIWSIDAMGQWTARRTSIYVQNNDENDTKVIASNPMRCYNVIVPAGTIIPMKPSITSRHTSFVRNILMVNNIIHTLALTSGRALPDNTDNILAPIQINGGGADAWRALIKLSQMGGVSHVSSKLMTINLQEAMENVSEEDYAEWKTLIRLSEWGAPSTENADLLPVRPEDEVDEPNHNEPEPEIPEDMRDDLILLSNWGAPSTEASKLWFTHYQDNLETIDDVWETMILMSENGELSTDSSHLLVIPYQGDLEPMDGLIPFTSRAWSVQPNGRVQIAITTTETPLAVYRQTEYGVYSKSFVQVNIENGSVVVISDEPFNGYILTT